MDWYSAIKGSVTMIIAIPALFVVMSFVLWQNAIKVVGWKYIARLTLVIASFPFIFEAINALKAATL